MGYSIHQITSDFSIPAHKTFDALNALKGLQGLETCGSKGLKHFMWINDSSDLLISTSLDHALKIWRWHATLDDEGGLVELDFSGENLGDEDLLFGALAPFVRDGSSIVVAGEDGAVWRWYFSEGRVIRQAGRILFDVFPTHDKHS